MRDRVHVRRREGNRGQYVEGGRTPLLMPAELRAMGFAMVAYPTSLIFRVAHTLEKALADMKAGTLSLEGEGVGFETFKRIVGYDEWAKVEDRFGR